MLERGGKGEENGSRMGRWKGEKEGGKNRGRLKIGVGNIEAKRWKERRRGRGSGKEE